MLSSFQKTNRLLFSLFFSLTISGTLTVLGQLPTGYTDELVFDFNDSFGVDTPMGTVFNSDGTRMFIWFYQGFVKVANWDGNSYVIQDQPVIDISDEVGAWRDFGLLSIALDPDFDSNGKIYMFYVVDREHLMNFPGPSYDPNANDYFEATISRLTRYELDLNSNPLTTVTNSRSVLLGETKETGIPLTHESHAGGTIVFGADGTLLLSTGDNASYISVDDGSSPETYYQQAINDGILRPEENVGAFRAQMLTSHCGKVLRLDPDTGDGIPSNPHYDPDNPRSPKSRMYAMGFRNPFRMSIQPGTGSTDPADGFPGILHVADVGWNTWEDLHIIDKPGLNAGWPLFEGLTALVSYQNTNTTNADENNELFKDNCIQPASWIDDPNPVMRRFKHNRPEVTWRHGGPSPPFDARVPSFNGAVPLDFKIGEAGSPTTGDMFNGNAAVAGVYLKNGSLGSFYEDKYFFTDYSRNFIAAGSLNDGSENWFNDITLFAPHSYRAGIVHMAQNPLDGFLYYTEIGISDIRRITFVPPYWTAEPADAIVEADGTPDPGNAFSDWLGSFSGQGACGTLTLTNDSSGLSDDCGSTGFESVTFTLTDECGNEITKTAIFIVEDTTAPVFNEALPPDISVSCDSIPSPETLTASDTAGTTTVAFIESTAPGSCEGEYVMTRTWTATDECGNETIHNQAITVTDTLAPGFNEALPEDMTVNCDNIPSPQNLTASDDCGLAEVSFIESTIPGGCPGESTIYRTWTATDSCGNERSHVQAITVVDSTNPTWENAPVNGSAMCEEDYEAEFQSWLNSFSGSDNCGLPAVSHNNSTSISCGESREVEFTLTDECGNSTSLSATFSTEDTLSNGEIERKELNVFPNPATNSFQIVGLRSDSELCVFNLAGQILMKTKIREYEKILVNWPSGVYLLKIIDQKNVILKRLMIE